VSHITEAYWYILANLCGYSLEITEVFVEIHDSFSFETAPAYPSLLLLVFGTNLPVSNHQDFSSPKAIQHSHGVYSCKLPLRLILGILCRHFAPSTPFHSFFLARYASNTYEQTWLKRGYKDILIHLDYIQDPVPTLPNSLDIKCTWCSKVLESNSLKVKD